MHQSNTVIILSDEHNRDVLGCYGDDIAKTPSLDKLARDGVRFTSAYANSPVCVPSRASFATGRYPHQINAWDSVSPYDGSIKGWGSRLLDAGHEVFSIGKLHFRRTEDNNGFSQEILPIHVHKGVGWLSSLLRNPPTPMDSDDMAISIGAGESVYTLYDRDVTQRACEWIEQAAENDFDKPWILYIGLVAPHFPLIAPDTFFHLYDNANIPPPRQYAESERPRHPVLDALRASCNYDRGFDEKKVQIARQAYYGLCSFMDDNVGKIINTIEASGLQDTTRIIYSSDHGDNIGNRGLWGKSVMYEDSVAIPLIIKGPDIPSNEIVKTPVSLVDLHPTLMAFVNEPLHPEDDDLPGQSLMDIIKHPDHDRSVFSEYHDWGSITGMFMLRKGDWKVICYPGYASQLFNLNNDPYEQLDLAANGKYKDVLDWMEAELSKIGNIESVNDKAFADQAIKIRAYGGYEEILKAEDLGYTRPPNSTASSD